MINKSKGSGIVLIDNLNVGDTVTDGYMTYVVDRDRELHYVGTGNHAKYHVSQKELKKELKKYESGKKAKTSNTRTSDPK